LDKFKKEAGKAYTKRERTTKPCDRHPLCCKYSVNVLWYKKIINLIGKTTLTFYKIMLKMWIWNWTYLWRRRRYRRWRLLRNTFPLSDMWRHSAFGRLCSERLQERIFRGRCLGRLPRRMLKTNGHMDIY